jgi:hypothetical protein
MSFSVSMPPAPDRGDTEMERRRIITQATIDKFGGHPFQWGKYDCAKMIAFHLRALGRPVAHAKAGSYSDALGAARSLKRLGYATMGDLMSARFLDIPPASCRLGDIIEFEADSPLGCLGIALGNNAVYCYVEDEPDGPVSARVITALNAWRVIGIG